MNSVPKRDLRKRPHPARSETSLRASALLRFLIHYLEYDPHLRGDLWQHVHAHRRLLRWLDRSAREDGFGGFGWQEIIHRAEAGDELIAPYVNGLMSILARNRLDQIPESADTFHTWCTISHGIGHPAYGLMVPFSEESPPGIRDISVTVRVNDKWVFSRQSRATARERLLDLCAEQVDAELDRIIDDHSDWIWPDAQPKVELHTEWAYRRFKGELPSHIAMNPGNDCCGNPRPEVARQTVSTATNKLADLIGITFP